ncbi:hypothetical protein D3C72_2066530 [compost metagenome]
MDPVDPGLARMLHEERKAAQEPRQAETDDHAHDDANMREDRRIRLDRVHERVSYSSGTAFGLPFSSSATITKIASVTFSIRCER